MTKQADFWQSEFGKEYTDRNRMSVEQLNQLAKDTYGVIAEEMNNSFLPKGIENVLQVGCNYGAELSVLKKQGFKNLYGIDIQQYAADNCPEGVNVIQGDALNLPFKDNCFDLVFTNGFLIHVAPENLEQVMKEIYRVAKKYIWIFEPYSKELQMIDYRGNKDVHWVGNYLELFQKYTPATLLGDEFYPYLTGSNIDHMFLLRK